jgi:hypothetical protein
MAGNRTVKVWINSHPFTQLQMHVLNQRHAQNQTCAHRPAPEERNVVLEGRPNSAELNP